MKQNFPPLQLTVPYPSQAARSRGVFATRIEDPPKSIRFSRVEVREIQRAANLCGMTEMAFVRYAASVIATAVHKAHNNE